MTTMVMMARSAWLGKKENTEAALSAFKARCQRCFHQNTQIHNLILLNILVKSAIWLTQHIKHACMSMCCQGLQNLIGKICNIFKTKELHNP